MATCRFGQLEKQLSILKWYVYTRSALVNFNPCCIKWIFVSAIQDPIKLVLIH